MPTAKDHTIVHTALDDVDASIRAQKLEENGIPTLKLGGTSGVAFGMIPAPEALHIELWVHNDQLETANQLMESFDEARGQSPASQWSCGCGEQNPKTFDVCWKCGATFGKSA